MCVIQKKNSASCRSTLDFQSRGFLFIIHGWRIGNLSSTMHIDVLGYMVNFLWMCHIVMQIQVHNNCLQGNNSNKSDKGQYIYVLWSFHWGILVCDWIVNIALMRHLHNHSIEQARITCGHDEFSRCSGLNTIYIKTWQETSFSMLSDCHFSDNGEPPLMRNPCCYWSIRLKCGQVYPGISRHFQQFLFLWFSFSLPNLLMLCIMSLDRSGELILTECCPFTEYH